MGIDEQRAHVEALCEAYGYGFVIHEASAAWTRISPRGAFVVGPCRACTVPCGCDGACDWCDGCGWLTRRVSQAKRMHESRQRMTGGR